MSTAALRLDNVTIRYGAAVAVEDVSLTVRRGEIVGLLGPNGSGKSTTLSAAAGLLHAGNGTVSIDGIDAARQPREYARRIGFVPQDGALYDELTAMQNLEFFGRLQGLRRHKLEGGIRRGLATARLADRAHERVSRFSGGMKQRLSIACALLHDPPLLLLDEPTASLDDRSREDLLNDLLQLRDGGHAILLTTHHSGEAERVCDRLAMLNRGRLTVRSHHRFELEVPGEVLSRRLKYTPAGQPA